MLPQKFKKFFSLFLRIVLTFSFLFSAYTKWVASGFFEITLLNQGIATTRGIAAILSRIIVGFEFSLGLLLLLPYYFKKTLWFVLFLLAAFTLHLVFLWASGDTENCGCFGEMIAMSPGESILKNLVLMGIALYLLFTGREKKERFYVLPSTFATALAITFWFLPLPQPEKFPFAEFTRFEGVEKVSLEQGEKLLAVFNLDCEHCQDLATQMGTLKKEYDRFPETYVLFFSEGTTTVEQFNALTQTQFPYRMIDVNTFFDLIGESPPRVYYLKNGAIEVIWDTEIAAAIEETFLTTY